MNTFVEFLILAPTILFGLSFHEFAHGWVAFKLGDPTAHDQGRRKTENPQTDGRRPPLRYPSGTPPYNDKDQRASAGQRHGKLRRNIK